MIRVINYKVQEHQDSSMHSSIVFSKFDAALVTSIYCAILPGVVHPFQLPEHICEIMKEICRHSIKCNFSENTNRRALPRGMEAGNSTLGWEIGPSRELHADPEFWLGRSFIRFDNVYNFRSKLLDDSYADYEYDYDPSITTISFNELLVPLLVYSITFILGVVGNILILLAVTAQ